MARIHVTCRNGSSRSIEAGTGQSLMLALKGCGIAEIAAICGGCASCGTCHVYVGEGWLERLPPMRADEEELLSYSDWRRLGSRLACQVPFTDALDGLAVTVAPED